MKKWISVLVLLLTFQGYSQTIPSYSTIKLTKPVLGTKNDSLVVRNGVSGGVLKILPVSEIKGTTNLDQLATPTGITIFSSTGNDVTLPLATTNNAGLQSPTDKAKLDGLSNFDPSSINTALSNKVDKVSGKSLLSDTEIARLAGIATGATANSTDAQLRDRTTHTGTQAISTVIGLQAAIDAKLNLSLVGANNGVTPLDAGGKVSFAFLPASLMIYKGMWNATTNTPTLSDATGVAGWVYKASVGGTINLGSGNITFIANDFLIHNGSKWEWSGGTDAVVSVNGQQGVVTLDASHIQETTNRRYQTDAQRTNNDATSPIQAQLNAKISNVTHTGDATGSTALTLATVNSNVGTFGNASNVPIITVNAKGLVTGASSGGIQIGQNQVTNLVTVLAGKQDTGAAHFVGTTSIANNRASGAQTLTGVSIDGNAATATTANNSNLLNGFTSSVFADDNTIVRRSGSSQAIVEGGYLKTTFAAVDAVTPAHFATFLNGDGVIRKSSPSQINTLLGLGSNAFSSTSIFRQINNDQLDANSPSINGAGKVFNASNVSSGGGYGTFMSFGSGEYQMQFNSTEIINSDIRVRVNGGGSGGGTFGSWRTIYDTQNFNPANYLLLGGGAMTGDITGVPKLRFNGSFSQPATFNTNSAGDKVVLFNDNGSSFDARIGIGTLSNVWFKAYGSTTSSGNFEFYTGKRTRALLLAANGDASFSNDVIAFSSSDKRLKDNITPIKNPLGKISMIGGYTFDWNEKQDTYKGHDVGVIAQEIEEVLPELVTTRENGYKAIKYDKLVALLIEGIKAQQKEITELKKQVYRINKKIK